MSTKIGNIDKIKSSYEDLTIIDSIQDNWKAAEQHYKLFIIYRDSIDNQETKKKNLESAMNYEFDKKEAVTKAEQDKKDAIPAEEKKRQKAITH